MDLHAPETSFDLVAPRGEELIDEFYVRLFEAAPAVMPLSRPLRRSEPSHKRPHPRTRWRSFTPTAYRHRFSAGFDAVQATRQWRQHQRSAFRTGVVAGVRDVERSATQRDSRRAARPSATIELPATETAAKATVRPAGRAPEPGAGQRVDVCAARRLVSNGRV